MNPLGLLPLFAWLSPAFPVGAFAYSHGLEQAVADGDVRDADTLAAWLRDLLAHGSIRTDVILAACSARAFVTDEAGLAEDQASPGFAEVAALAIALQPSRERRLETCQQGRSFLEALCAAWPSQALDRLLEASPQIAYPVAFGAAVAAHNLPLRPALAAYALQFAGNLVSAVVRLGVVGQTDGQRIIASLAGAASHAAKLTAGAGLGDLGSASFRSDLASIRHETKYSRIFRS
jgi:urease accessory protein